MWTQILNPCHLLPRSCGVVRFQASQSRSVRQEGDLRSELWCAEDGVFGVGQIVSSSGFGGAAVFLRVQVATHVWDKEAAPMIGTFRFLQSFIVKE